MSRRPRSLTALLSVLALALNACGGAGSGASSGSSGGGTSGGGGGGGAPSGVYAVPASEALTAADVQQVVAQAVAEAQARGAPAVVAVTDRLGNVLAVYSMTGASPTATVTPGPSGNLDLQGAAVPATLAAIAKAITGAYLSSGGNAFSTRTASMIVQQNFPPGPAGVGLESGPLFGVQFSQLPCSDLSRRFVSGGGASAFVGPKRSPLGLAADPGGFPLYKNGVLVGGVGVMADGQYGFDPNVQDTDNDTDEAIALAATHGLDAPAGILADQISLGGTTLRYSDATSASLKSNPATAPGFGSLSSGVGGLTRVNGYYDGSAVLPGQAYGAEGSGVRKATSAEFDNPDAFVLTDGSGGDRYPARAGADTPEVSSPLTAAEVTALLQEAFKVMSHARAQIRQPLNSLAQVTISVVDTRGSILGIVRSPDAPVFGIDVSLQKARTASFFSGPFAASDLSGDPSADVRSFVQKTRDFLNDPNALTGRTAFSVRAIGNISRPFFPDGQAGQPNGPLSRPISQWSVFSTGLQSALILGNVLQHVGYVANNLPDASDTPARCAHIPDVAPGQNRLQNGIQIFPGGFPIYRGGVLIGGIGVSGDGVDQDDMISFLGLSNAASRVGSIGQAAAAIRADQLVIGSTRLRYANCPVAPFIDTSQQNVCQGL